MICIFSILASSSVCLGQSNFDRSLNNPIIYWYGLDFSKLVIYDFTKLSDGEEIKEEVCPQWIGYFKKHVDNKKLRKLFDKEAVVDVSSQLSSSYDQIDHENFVRIDGDYKITDDQLKELVKSYELNETDGLGLVVVLESMRKLDREVSEYGLFFDIKSREILFKVQESGRWDSYGFVALYGSAINEGVSRIGDRYRRDVLKTFK